MSDMLSRKEYSPCYGCPDREVGCHGQCPDYQAWAAVKDQERKDRLLMRRGEPDKIGVSKIKMYNKRVEVGGNE